ncbi:MAG: SDR family oxidoreductase [Gemmatimonadetes bacterium]|nr:SDR family oxidoreductase [Gemmatimonadota bacterium]
MKTILVIGATSRIAHEVARGFAASGAELFLVGRGAEKLEAVAGDLRVRGAARVTTFLLDVNDLRRHQEMLAAAHAALGTVDLALIAHGTLPDQRRCEQSVPETLSQFATNATSVMALLTLLASHFEQQRRGSIAVITSVAGDRGRRSNYVYGAAKGAVTLFLQGLRNRLFRVGVTVTTIKPGFVDTPMTAHLPKSLLFASADRVGRSIHRAILRRKDVAYVPWFWRWMMLAVRLVPERVFKRLEL